jgi:hypothetical protein
LSFSTIPQLPQQSSPPGPSVTMRLFPHLGHLSSVPSCLSSLE